MEKATSRAEPSWKLFSSSPGSSQLGSGSSLVYGKIVPPSDGWLWDGSDSFKGEIIQEKNFGSELNLESWVSQFL